MLKDQNPHLVQAAQQGQIAVDAETGIRRGSVGGGMKLDVFVTPSNPSPREIDSREKETSTHHLE